MFWVGTFWDNPLEEKKLEGQALLSIKKKPSRERWPPSLALKLTRPLHWSQPSHVRAPVHTCFGIAGTNPPLSDGTMHTNFDT